MSERPLIEQLRNAMKILGDSAWYQSGEMAAESLMNILSNLHADTIEESETVTTLKNNPPTVEELKQIAADAQSQKSCPQCGTRYPAKQCDWCGFIPHTD